MTYRARWMAFLATNENQELRPMSYHGNPEGLAPDPSDAEVLDAEVALRERTLSRLTFRQLAAHIQRTTAPMGGVPVSIPLRRNDRGVA